MAGRVFYMEGTDAGTLDPGITVDWNLWMHCICFAENHADTSAERWENEYQSERIIFCTADCYCGICSE